MKKFTALFSLAAACLICSFPAAAAPTQWSVGSGGNGNWYELRASPVFPTGIDWNSANTLATTSIFGAATGHLVTLTSAAENNFVFGLLSPPALYQVDGAGNSQGPWIGALRTGPGVNDWAWVTAEPFTFTAWAPGEPNNFNGIEDRGQYFCVGSAPCTTGTWNDIPQASLQLGYIVEWEAAQVGAIPEPSTYALMLAGLGFVGFVANRRRKAHLAA